jgi:hypothetical protein
MEEWKNHYHLSGGRCYEMYFISFDCVIRFKVVGLNSFGGRTAINCDTNEKFEFNRESLLKKEYATLREIECNC